MKRLFPYVLGLLLGAALCAALLVVTTQPRGDAITLLPVATPAPLLVDVSGAVVSAGVYSLPPGSRVAEALAVAGGLSPQADPVTLNLAARLKDGQKLHVPEVQSQQAGSGDAQPTAGSPVTYPLDLNTATLEELDSLPGIGPTRAQQIVDYRDAQGGFASIDELMQVAGIGEITFSQLKDLIAVEALP